MIIRGAAGRKLPHGRVFIGDVLYFIYNNGEGEIKAKASVAWVFNSEKMTEEESVALIKKYQKKLLLTDKQFERWGGKRYIVLIEVINVKEITPAAIERGAYGNMDDWLPVENINSAILKL